MDDVLQFLCFVSKDSHFSKKLANNWKMGKKIVETNLGKFESQ